jgi:hypothetical protein
MKEDFNERLYFPSSSQFLLGVAIVITCPRPEAITFCQNGDNYHIQELCNSAEIPDVIKTGNIKFRIIAGMRT